MRAVTMAVEKQDISPQAVLKDGTDAGDQLGPGSQVEEQLRLQDITPRPGYRGEDGVARSIGAAAVLRSIKSEPRTGELLPIKAIDVQTTGGGAIDQEAELPLRRRCPGYKVDQPRDRAAAV